MAADAAIHGSFNHMVYMTKFIFVGWLQLNLVTEFASGSVDGRVRGHDEKGREFRTMANIQPYDFTVLSVLRPTYVNPVALKGPARGEEAGP